MNLEVEIQTNLETRRNRPIYSTDQRDMSRSVKCNGWDDWIGSSSSIFSIEPSRRPTRLACVFLLCIRDVTLFHLV